MGLLGVAHRPMTARVSSEVANQIANGLISGPIHDAMTPVINYPMERVLANSPKPPKLLDPLANRQI